MPQPIPLVSAQYLFGANAVTLLVQHPEVLLMLYCRETDLVALQPDGTPLGTPWGDAEALLAAQTLVDARFPNDGFTVVFQGEPA